MELSSDKEAPFRFLIVTVIFMKTHLPAADMVVQATILKIAIADRAALKRKNAQETISEA
jgi:hypothetical protein